LIIFLELIVSASSTIVRETYKDISSQDLARYGFEVSKLFQVELS